MAALVTGYLGRIYKILLISAEKDADALDDKAVCPVRPAFTRTQSGASLLALCAQSPDGTADSLAQCQGNRASLLQRGSAKGPMAGES